MSQETANEGRVVNFNYTKANGTTGVRAIKIHDSLSEGYKSIQLEQTVMILGPVRKKNNGSSDLGLVSAVPRREDEQRRIMFYDVDAKIVDTGTGEERDVTLADIQASLDANPHVKIFEKRSCDVRDVMTENQVIMAEGDGNKSLADYASTDQNSLRIKYESESGLKMTDYKGFKQFRQMFLSTDQNQLDVDMRNESIEQGRATSSEFATQDQLMSQRNSIGFGQDSTPISETVATAAGVQEME